MRRSLSSKRLKQRSKSDIRIPRLIKHLRNSRRDVRDIKGNSLS